MKMSRMLFVVALELFLTIFSSCYVHTKVKQIHPEKMLNYKLYENEEPTKVFLIDGSVIVFEHGFKMEDKMIKGEGIKYDLSRENQSVFSKYHSSKVPVDSISHMQYYTIKIQPYASFIQNPILVFFALSVIYGAVARGGE